MLTPLECQTLWAYAEDIRSEVPIVGTTATENECRRRRELIDALLTSWDEESGDDRSAMERGWYSVLLGSRRVVGQWAHDEVEAGLGVMVWFGEVADIVARDNDQYWRRSWQSALGEARVDLASGELVPAGGLLDLLEDS